MPASLFIFSYSSLSNVSKHFVLAEASKQACPLYDVEEEES